MMVMEGRQSFDISVAANLDRVQLGSNPILMESMVYDFPRKVRDQSGRTGRENHGRNEENEKCMNIPITFSQKSKILIEILLANKKKINFNINFIFEGGAFLNILT